jgi:hypothetical protein
MYWNIKHIESDIVEIIHDAQWRKPDDNCQWSELNLLPEKLLNYKVL